MLPDRVQSHKTWQRLVPVDTVLLYRRSSPPPMTADRRVRPHVLSIPNKSITVSNYKRWLDSVQDFQKFRTMINRPPDSSSRGFARSKEVKKRGKRRNSGPKSPGNFLPSRRLGPSVRPSGSFSRKPREKESARIIIACVYVCVQVKHYKHGMRGGGVLTGMARRGKEGNERSLIAKRSTFTKRDLYTARFIRFPPAVFTRP